MGKYLVLDTETSGLFDFAQPADALGQPRLASVAMLFLDTNCSLEYEWQCLVRPDGWQMNQDAISVHGLTNERLSAEGLPIVFPLAVYAGALEQGRTVIAYNSQFDLKMMRGELRRAGMPDRYEHTPSLCMMKAATDICRIPKPSGYGWKWPKLAEAYLALFNEEHCGAHGAVEDARACHRIFRELAKRELLPAAVAV